MNDAALADRYSWIIYVVLTLAVLTTSYVIIISKFIRRPHVQQLGSVMSAERKLSVTLFIVTAASILTLLPWVIIICISISSDRYSWIQLTPIKIASTFYHFNPILNPVIYAIRLTEIESFEGAFLQKQFVSSKAGPTYWTASNVDMDSICSFVDFYQLCVNIKCIHRISTIKIPQM